MSSTAVILGAGSSADFGLPLGATLYSQAVTRLLSLKGDWERQREQSSLFSYESCVRFMKADPFRISLLPSVLSVDDNGQKQFSLSSIFDLIEIMGKAPAYSIDTLALEYPEYASIFKVLTAKLIIDSIKQNIEETSSRTERRIFERRTIRSPNSQVSSLSNWIHLFCSMSRNALAKNEDNKYSIISFNYDRIFEKAASAVWAAPSRNLGPFEDVFTIHYPHGKIDWIINQSDRSELSVEQSDIIFAHNKPEGFSTEEMKTDLAQSGRIIFLGFHFSPENIDTLGLLDCDRNIEIIYQNFDQNRGLDRRVNDMGFQNVRMFSGPISEAILQGELPS